MPNDSFHLCIDGLKECAINTTTSIAVDSLPALHVYYYKGEENWCRGGTL